MMTSNKEIQLDILPYEYVKSIVSIYYHNELNLNTHLLLYKIT